MQMIFFAKESAMRVVEPARPPSVSGFASISGAWRMT